jgi:site-specific DNA recombinase
MTTTTTKRTAAIYARYSSDIQNDRSVDDQVADCKKFAAREKIAIAEIHSDRAKSGASIFDRDGLLELMQRAKARRFTTVIVESLDRLSRDQEDLAGIYKRLKFYGVEILTLNEGTTTSIHIGIRGLVGSLFLADLGAKVRRGATGRVRDGKIPGAVAYGYGRVLGKPGECRIDPVQAEIVRRVFREYVAGRSPRAIALDLTRDGIASPNGGAWNHQTFLSNKYKTGLLSNPIYVGKLQWNKTRTVRNPETGKRIKRPAEAHELVTADVPHLRIIDQRLWDSAAAVQRSRSDVVMRGRVIGRPMLPRCEHLLAGLLRCGVCGGIMRVNGPRWLRQRIEPRQMHAHQNL